MRGEHIFLAVPTRGAVQWQTATRIEEIRDRTPGLAPILYQPGNLSVALTRNRIVRRFLKTDCTILAMVDDDVVPPPHMLEALEPLIGRYAMAAIPHPHPHPSDRGAIVLSAYAPGSGGTFVPAQLEEGSNEVAAAATGCFLIDRGALEALEPNPFRIPDDPDDPIQSDDLLFCLDLAEAGYRICAWNDGWYCDHVTTVGLAPLHERSASVHAPA